MSSSGVLFSHSAVLEASVGSGPRPGDLDQALPITLSPSTAKVASDVSMEMGSQACCTLRSPKWGGRPDPPRTYLQVPYLKA